MTRFELHHRDCLEGMREMPPGTVDIVVTSPPYNLGIAYSKYRDNQARSKYLDWSQQWAGEVKRLLKPDGALFLNVGAVPANPFLPHELVLRLRDLFVLQNTLHWIKSITVKPKRSKDLSVGHFKPINSQRFVTDCHEFVFHLTKTGDVKIDRLAVGVEYSDKSNIDRWGHTGGKDRRCRGNNWFIPYETIQRRNSERPHPATFPAALAAWCLKLHGPRKELVMLDPFLGIGHSALAARECSVSRFIGFEIDKAYLKEAEDRLASESAILDLPL